ncbi:MAG: UDP-N-acetylmuramoyl-tripeptide--D-alanyl-D-alanine ligase [Chitinivibrionales bacterium]|nr:UDP-N-acetylmuramoyl-tripeptide--D-alanyl-D-alanine ligase [Chitinivibrionales bacterium]
MQSVPQHRLTLETLARWGRAAGPADPAARRHVIHFVNNDSRTIEKNDLFVALTTGSNDGHRYVADALAAGAIAAIVDKKKAGQFDASVQKRLLLVDDPLAAVQRMAARYRKELGILMVGITGSSGKTTTRTFMADVLSHWVTVGQTSGNFNNHIGLPFSILRFTGKEFIGILEMGANHAHEISALTNILRPDIGVVTNIGYAHIGFFKSLAATTRAKFEIAEGLRGRRSFLLVNGDDPRCVAGAKTTGKKTHYFGFGPACDLRATDVVYNCNNQLCFKVNGRAYRLRMAGRHFIMCALPAIFLAQRTGMDAKAIVEALAALKPVNLRGGMVTKRGTDYILDCYNANPSSMQSALQTLADIGGDRRRVAVVGDMLELGRFSGPLHRALGKQIAQSGVSRLIAVGNFSKEVAHGARAAGMPAAAITTASDAASAIEIARAAIKPGDKVLIKASRGIALEKVFEAL